MTIRLTQDVDPVFSPPASTPPADPAPAPTDSGSGGGTTTTTTTTTTSSSGGGTSAPVSAAVSAAANQLKEVASREPVVASFEVTVPASGTPVRLPSYRLPAGASIEVRAKSNNTNAVYVGKNTRVRVAANSPAPGAIMIRNTDIPAYLGGTNLSDYMLDADTNGEGILIIVRWGGRG